MIIAESKRFYLEKPVKRDIIDNCENYYHTVTSLNNPEKEGYKMKKYKLIILLAFCCFFLVFFINADGSTVKKIALIIGNGAYKANTLQNPPNDAADISNSLTRLGFRVTKLINADKRQMQNAIRDFGRELMKDWNTMGIFYYAGHGCNVKGINYLVPVGADIKAEDEVEYQAVDVGFVLSKMESAGNRVNILILDACRDNPFASSRSANRGLTVVQAPKGSLVVYATAPGSVAADGKGRNGVFTGAFLENLKNNPSMDIELFMRNVRRDVMAETGNEQVPWTSSSLTESITFKDKPQADKAVITVPEKKPEKVTDNKKENIPVGGFFDDFNVPTLDGRWQLLNEDPKKWSLENPSGFLILKTGRNNILSTDLTLENCLIEINLKLSPWVPFSRAGFTIFLDKKNYITLMLYYPQSTRISFYSCRNGSSDEKWKPYSGRSVYLRIVKHGVKYTGFYSADGERFIQVGEVENPLGKNLSLQFFGFSDAMSSMPNTAYFDYVRVTPLAD